MIQNLWYYFYTLLDHFWAILISSVLKPKHFWMISELFFRQKEREDKMDSIWRLMGHVIRLELEKQKILQKTEDTQTEYTIKMITWTFEVIYI